MEFTAIARSVRIAPRKVRLVADAIRKLPLDKAMANLSLIEKRGASVLITTFKSAIANALNNAKKKQDELMIKSVDVFEGASLKRFHASTRGRVHPFKKRSSHIKIVLTDDQSQKGGLHGKKS